MKTGTYLSAILSLALFLAQTEGAPAGNTVAEDFSKCQATYKEVISHISTSEGEEAAATIWRLVFHNMDLDGNGRLAAAEITLFFESQGYIHASDVMDAMHEVDEWIKLGDDKDGELTTKEFVSVVEKTMKENTDSSSVYFHVSYGMCHLFTSKVPHIAESMTALESCTKRLEASILADKTERAEFNSWYAIFETLDLNGDKKIDFDELKQLVGHTLSTNEDISIASALGHAIYGTVHHEVKDVTEQNFYIFIHELLYGLNGVPRQHSWGDVYDEHELKGREMLCNVIYGVRKQLTGQRDVMSDCIKSYRATKEKVLGEDGVFAPEIVFTMADADRDGKISKSEFDAFIGTSSTLFGAVERKHATKSMKISEFRLVMPDVMVDAQGKNSNGGEKGIFELSSMTSSELRDAEKLCYAIITSVEKYPTHEANKETNHHEMPPPSESFKGFGEFIMKEHTLPPKEEHATHPPAPVTPTREILHMTDHFGDPIEVEIRHPSATPHHEEHTEPTHHSEGHYNHEEENKFEFDIGLTPPAPTRGSSSGDGDGVVYHMYDKDGNPIQIHMSKVEIDDIIHRMATASEPPVEPQNAHPAPEEEHRTDDESTNELMKEVSRILNGKAENQQQTDEEMQLKKLLESMGNGAVNES